MGVTHNYTNTLSWDILITCRQGLSHHGTDEVGLISYLVDALSPANHKGLNQS